jgi:hypothetical protein
MISGKSRYVNNPVVLVSSNRGPVVTIAPLPPQPRVLSYTYVRLADGDRLDLMAVRLYGDERLWWKIADANPEILDWTDVPMGTVLRVPSD